MSVVSTAHESAVLDEFAILRENLPPRFRIVVDALADEHLALMRLVNGNGTTDHHIEEDAE